MKERIEKAKQYVTEHKKEFALGATVVITTVAVGVTFVITKKKPKIGTLETPTLFPKLTILDLPDSLKEIGVTELSSNQPDEWIDIWMSGVPLSELGRFGEEVQKACGASVHSVGGVVTMGIETGSN